MLGMIIVHTCAVILGVFANKLIGGSVIGILNILFGTEMVLYFAFELFARLNYLQGLIMLKAGMDFSIQDLQWFH